MGEAPAVGAAAGQDVDPTAAREAAREILSRPEYSEPQPSVVERAVDWVLERLGAVFATLTGGGPGSVIGWLVVIGLVLGATWLLARALRVPAVGARVQPDGVRYGTETRRDPDEWRREAERLEALGDLRGALRCRYQELLAVLVARGVVDDVPGRTAGEYRRLVAGALPAAARDIDAVTAGFERAWYGGAAVTGDQLRHVVEAADAVALHAREAVVVR